MDATLRRRGGNIGPILTSVLVLTCTAAPSALPGQAPDVRRADDTQTQPIGGPSALRQRPPCASTEARQFDFWIGTWDIRQSILRRDGSWLSLPARTSVRPALDGCALVEQWEGEVMFFWEGMTEPRRRSGLSVRAYDPETKQWYIHWMDTGATRFGPPFIGGFIDGRGQFVRETEAPDGKRLDRITFQDVTESSLDWELAVSADGGSSWQPVWRMRMERRAEVPEPGPQS
jgi:hypothetical protein